MALSQSSGEMTCDSRVCAAMAQTDGRAAVAAVLRIMQRLQDETGLFNEKVDGYVRTFVVRKIVFAMVVEGPWEMDWGKVLRPEFQSMCCDENQYLQEFDATWTAGEISSFVFGRDDWPMLVSVFACLWHDAFDKKKKAAREQIISDIVVGNFGRKARLMRASSGHAWCPALIAKRSLAD